jgi:hypothetical protein
MEEFLESNFHIPKHMGCQLSEVKFASHSHFSRTEFLSKTMLKKQSLHQLKRDKIHSNPTTNGVVAATETLILTSISLNLLIAVLRDGREIRVSANFQNLMENRSLSKSLQSKIVRITRLDRSLAKSH